MSGFGLFLGFLKTTQRILFCTASMASASKYTKYSGFVQFERKPTRTKPSREWTAKTKELIKLL